MHFVQMLCRAAQINGNSRAIKNGSIERSWVEVEDRVANLAGAYRAFSFIGLGLVLVVIGWLYQRDAEEITVQPVEDSMPKIDQFCMLTTGRNKLADLTEIILTKGYRRVMVFCNTKYTTAMLANQLARLNFSVDCLHGDLSQAERNKIMARFKAGEIPVLVATDVAARGIDVTDVDAVFNYDVPDSNEYYTHRIGRTGRAKHEGTSYLLYTKDERARVNR
mgnify:CR=1 FL=1